MKRKSIFLGTIAIVLLLGVIPMVGAKSTHRPIEDWLVPDLGVNPDILGWGVVDDEGNSLSIWPHYTAEFVLTPIWECDYAGYIHEKALKDGRIEVIVYLDVKDVPAVVLLNGMPIFEGIVKYTWKFHFILDPNHPDYDDFFIDEEGNLLYGPYWYYYYGFGDSVEFINVHVLLTGEGGFIGSYQGWEAGDFAKVAMNQVGMMDKDFDEGHPHYYPDYEAFWPVEFLFFH